jgi:dihydroneopterin triphosphate diphosphatase
VRKNREAAIFIHRGDEFLVFHRSSDGIWNVCAGQIEEGESYADGAARELREETGLVAPLVGLTMPQPYEVEERFQHLYAPGEYIVMVESFAVEAPAGWEPTLNHEHDEYRWSSLTDALELLHWPEVKDGLRALAERLAAR